MGRRALQFNGKVVHSPVCAPACRPSPPLLKPSISRRAARAALRLRVIWLRSNGCVNLGLALQGNVCVG